MATKKTATKTASKKAPKKRRGRKAKTAAKAARKATKGAGGKQVKRRRISQKKLGKITPEIVTRLQDGESQTKVAKLFKISVPTVSRIAKEHGIKPKRGRRAAIQKRGRPAGRRGRKPGARKAAGNIFLIHLSDDLVRAFESVDAARAYVLGYTDAKPDAAAPAIHQVTGVQTI